MGSEILSVDCPFCRNQHLALKIITPGEAGDHLRSYDDSPYISRHNTPQNSNRAQRSGGFAKVLGPSPLKVGDSFEK